MSLLSPTLRPPAVWKLALGTVNARLDFRCPFWIVIMNRTGFAQGAIQFNVQLDHVARRVAAENFEVLGLPARLAEDDESVG
jgi:hypothetical protein